MKLKLTRKTYVPFWRLSIRRTIKGKLGIEDPKGKLMVELPGYILWIERKK